MAGVFERGGLRKKPARSAGSAASHRCHLGVALLQRAPGAPPVRYVPSSRCPWYGWCCSGCSQSAAR